MLFWYSILLDLIITIIICCFIPSPWVIPAGIAIYAVLSACSVLLLLVLSVRLGKSGPRELRKIISYNITQYDDKEYFINDNGKICGPISLRFADLVLYIKDLEQPYAEVYQYDVSGWRRRWLKEFYDDLYIIKVYLPSKDEA